MKILYLYDIDNWAIHNVGKLWFENVKQHEIVFKNFFEVQDEKKIYINFDLIWFGYIDLYLFSKEKPKNSIVSIHDPKEIFDQVPNWKKTLPNKDKIDILRTVFKCVTISRELFTILTKYGIDVEHIPTASRLPYRDTLKVFTEKSDITSVFQVYRRKNPDLMYSLQQKVVNELNIKFDLKVGRDILTRTKYIKYLDSHEIYICTSYQEGGPIPVMDAMNRGMVILSTPVGQVLELVEDGVNGFFCYSFDDFYNKIQMLSEDLILLDSMRQNAIATIKSKRSLSIIDQKVDIVINKFYR